MKCDKCHHEEEFLIKYRIVSPEDVTNVSLCTFCNRIFDVPLLQEFLKDDYGTFPISRESKSMLEARKKRAQGQSPWE
jgi:hypothetical protein